jgi:hypothetical protein
MTDWQPIVLKRAAVLKSWHQHARIASRRYFNVSEFLQLNENVGCFLRHEFLAQSWNNGIVERWNSGFSKDIIHFKLYRQAEFCHLPNIAVSSPSRRLSGPEVKTHFFNIPAFHHSNWGEALNWQNTGVLNFVHCNLLGNLFGGQGTRGGVFIQNKIIFCCLVGWSACGRLLCESESNLALRAQDWC